MVPTNRSAIIAFLIFVAPGIPWAERVQQRQSWRSNDSTFREIGRGVLWSILCSLPATLVTAALLYEFDRNGYRDLRQWFLSGRPPNIATLFVATVCGFVELLIAIGILRLYWKFLANLLYGPLESSRASAWQQFLAKTSPDDVVSAQVIVTDGSSWIGQVQAYSTDNAWEDREIVLSNAARADLDPSGGKGPIRPGHLVIPSV